MANWVKFGQTHYYAPEAIDTWVSQNKSFLKKYYIEFYYDNDRSSSTELVCRAKFGHSSWGNGYGTDFFYMYVPSWNTAYRLHNGGDGTDPKYNYQRVIPDYSGEFKLTKNWNATHFTMPDFVVFCQGREGTIGSFDKGIYDDSRKNWHDKESGSSYSVEGIHPSGLDSSKLQIYTSFDGRDKFSIRSTIP